MLELLTTFAQETLSDPNNYTYTSPVADNAVMGFDSPVVIISMILSLLALPATWVVYRKAGKAGWKAIVPLYNIYVMLQIVGRPAWWILLILTALLSSFVPLIGLIGLVVAIIVTHDLSKSFGRGVGITILNILLPVVGMSILAWGKAEYKGPSALRKHDDQGNDSGVPKPPTPPVPTPTA